MQWAEYRITMSCEVLTVVSEVQQTILLCKVWSINNENIDPNIYWLYLAMIYYGGYNVTLVATTYLGLPWSAVIKNT